MVKVLENTGVAVVFNLTALTLTLNIQNKLARLYKAKSLSRDRIYLSWLSLFLNC